MTLLPPINTPLNQHSLSALELWLTELGAEQNVDDRCLWNWVTPNWRAEIQVEFESLLVTWEKDGIKNQRSFPYGLSRNDVEAAMRQGP